MCAGIAIICWLRFLSIYAKEWYSSILFLVFWGTSILFSLVDGLIYFPTKSVRHSHQQLLLFVFLMIAILTGVRWNLNDVLICIFPLWVIMVNTSCVWRINISYFEKCSISHSLCGFWCLLSSLYILSINLLSSE
jgi:hypothetical protein